MTFPKQKKIKREKKTAHFNYSHISSHAYSLKSDHFKNTKRSLEPKT